MTTPSGTIYLVKNAVIDRTYNHTIDFKSPEEQRAYWGSLIKYSMYDVSYIRRQRPYLKIDKHIDELQDVNYLFYQADNSSKWYYAFVTGKEWFSDKTTYVYFEVDVLQTYMFDYKVKESYVLQEHVDRWNVDKTPIYSRTDEGLNYGDEYTVENAYKITSNLEEELQEDNDYNATPRFYIALLKGHEYNHNDNTTVKYPSDIPSIVNPYIMLLLPSNAYKNFTLYDASVSYNIDGVDNFMEDMANGDLGEYVQQIFKINYNPFKNAIKFKGDDIVFDNTAITQPGGTGVNGLGVFSRYNYNDHTYLMLDNFIIKKLGLIEDLATMGVFEGLEGAMPTAEQWAEVKSKPRTTPRDKRFESKLLTYPYRYNLLTDWKNTPSVIKNEYLAGDDITVKFTQGIGFNGTARYWIDNYRKDLEGRGNALMQLTSEELPVVNDAYYSYMLSNRNQIEANKTNAVISSVANVGQSLIGGMIFGGGVGAISGAMGGAVSGAVNYTNMVRSENAKQKDLKNLPDTIVNSNDASFNIFDRNEYLTFYRMKICCEFEEMLADAFHLTGYTVKRVKLPNLKTRTRFNYVKTAGANIVGSFDQEDLTKIKAIFDNGVTFWHYSSTDFNPLDYSYENVENSLL